MASLTPAARDALWAWPYVESSAARVDPGITGILSSSDWPLPSTRAAGGSVSQLWGAIKSAEPDNPEWRSIRFGAGLSTLRGIANSAVSAQHALSRAPAGSAIDSRMIGDWPTARSLAARTASPLYDVQIGVTGVTRGGAQVDRVLHVMYSAGLPATVGDLVDEVTQTAINRSLASDFTPIATGVPSILGV